jgi:hypothetical protein
MKRSTIVVVSGLVAAAIFVVAFVVYIGRYLA